jgi:hypothetical protein
MTSRTVLPKEGDLDLLCRGLSQGPYGEVPPVKRKRIPHKITISFTLIRECRPLGINGTVPYPFPLIFGWGRKS